MRYCFEGLDKVQQTSSELLTQQGCRLRHEGYLEGSFLCPHPRAAINRRHLVLVLPHLHDNQSDSEPNSDRSLEKADWASAAFTFREQDNQDEVEELGPVAEFFKSDEQQREGGNGFV